MATSVVCIDGHDAPPSAPTRHQNRFARRPARTGIFSAALAVAVVVGGAPGTASAAPPPDSGAYRPNTYVVPYTYQKQATNHWCSAAAARIALSVRGKMVSQATLAKELRLGPAHSDGPGLPNIQYLANALNKHLGARHYTVHQWPDRATLAAKLRAHVRYNIDHKLAVVINVNRIGSAKFPPGHYATIVGYRFHGKEFLVSDPFNPARRGVWMKADTVVGGIKLNRYVA